jgi:hypothetical protein
VSRDLVEVACRVAEDDRKAAVDRVPGGVAADRWPAAAVAVAQARQITDGDGAPDAVPVRVQGQLLLGQLGHGVRQRVPVRDILGRHPYQARVDKVGERASNHSRSGRGARC